MGHLRSPSPGLLSQHSDLEVNNSKRQGSQRYSFILGGSLLGGLRKWWWPRESTPECNSGHCSWKSSPQTWYSDLLAGPVLQQSSLTCRDMFQHPQLNHHHAVLISALLFTFHFMDVPLCYLIIDVINCIPCFIGRGQRNYKQFRHFIIRFHYITGKLLHMSQ